MIILTRFILNRALFWLTLDSQEYFQRSFQDLESLFWKVIKAGILYSLLHWVVDILQNISLSFYTTYRSFSLLEPWIVQQNSCHYTILPARPSYNYLSQTFLLCKTLFAAIMKDFDAFIMWNLGHYLYYVGLVIFLTRSYLNHIGSKQV